MVEIQQSEIVQVDRFARYALTQPLGSPRPGVGEILDETVTVHLGDATSTLSTKHLIPLLLYRQETTKDLVLVAASDDCLIWGRNGKPQPAYWAFRHRDSQWYRTELPSDAFGRKANLLLELLPSRPELTGVEVQERLRSQLTSQRVPARFLTVRADGDLKNCGRMTESDSPGDFDSIGAMNEKRRQVR